MKLVTRYILREHIGPLFFAVTTLTSLLLLNYISKRFADFVGKGLPWSVIGEFFLLSIPFTLAMTLPMAVLIATLYAFSRLAADSEITALMSTGVGARQLMSPVIAAGALLALGMLVFNDQFLPRANFRLNALQGSIAQKKPTLALKPQVLNEVSMRGVYMWTAQVDQRRNALRGVTIYDVTEPQTRRTIVADSAHLAFAPNRRDLLLTLYDGYVEETQTAQPVQFQRTDFRTNIMRVADVDNEFESNAEGGYKGDREMTICEMQESIERARTQRDSSLRSLAEFDPEAAADFAPTFGTRVGAVYCSLTARLLPKVAEAQSVQTTFQGTVPQDSVAHALKSAVAQRPGMPVRTEAVVQSIRSNERSISSFEVEIHKKFAISLACLIFAMLGPPIALRFPRSGVGLTIGVSLSVFALYYIGLIAGESLANDNIVPPAVAMWAANVILATAAVVLGLGMGRSGATGRGGEAPLFLQRLGRLFHRRSATA